MAKDTFTFPSYGLPLFEQNCSYEKARLVLVTVPWSATASFGDGANNGPEIIASSSSQMDFFSKDASDVRHQGIYLALPPDFLKTLNQQTRKKAQPILALESRAPGRFAAQPVMTQINQACQQMVSWVYGSIKTVDQAGKLFGLIGGDHSVSEGALRYVGEKYKGDFGILHIDAHADLRKAYQGFRYSHASVMYNVLHQKHPPLRLTQVGIRDYSEAEYHLIQSQDRIRCFFDSRIQQDLFEGITWAKIVDAMIKTLPKRVYISIDVDGLSPDLFPHTGTPVPGGLSFAQTSYLLEKLVASGRKVIGFDLVEVAGPKEKQYIWDGYVAARLLYIICQTYLLST